MVGWATPKDVWANFRLELFKMKEFIVEMTVDSAAKLIPLVQNGYPVYPEIYDVE